MPDAEVVLTRHLDHPPADVFAWCTDPTLLALWLGPKGFSACDVESDVRVGGRFAFRMQGEDGVYAAEGVYRELTPPTKVVLTWRWTEGPAGEEPDGVESLLTYEIRAEGKGTLLTLIHQGLLDETTADSHTEGWSEALDKLVRAIAQSTTRRAN